MKNFGFLDSATSVAWILGNDALPAHVDAERIALRWADTTRTYGELRQRALSMATALGELGLTPGDRVAAHFLNRGETFELYFACAFGGFTMVPINFRLSSREIGYVLEDCTPAVVFTQADLAELIPAVDFPTTVIELASDDPGERYEQLASGPQATAGFTTTDPQLILYTSGTTGQPKGVELSHRTVMAFAFQQAALYPGLDSTAVTLITGPTYNTAGIHEHSIPTFLVGGTVAIHPSRGWRPERTSQLVDAWGVTHAVVYPSMFRPFLEADGRERIGLESMRFILTGGENCPPAAVEKFRERWSHISFAIGYGQTEAGMISIIADEEIAAHPGSVGRAMIGQIFRVVDPEGNPLPPGVDGEIWTTGPNVISGYWRAPDLTASALKDGWLATGDLGHVDEDGYLYLVGRSRDLIISKGQNIYPAEIENAISEHDRVLDVTVVALPDEEFGEVVCAVVVPTPAAELTAAEVIEFVRGRLASYKKPRHVVFVDELPRSPSGKVIKAEVVETAGSMLVAS